MFSDSRTVTVVRPPAKGLHGDPASGTATEFDIDGCLLGPVESTENADQAETVTSGFTLYRDRPVDIRPTDRVRVDGALHDVIGRVRVWGNAGIEVSLSRVTGWNEGADMAAGVYKPNNKGFQEIAVGPEIRRALLVEAERGLEYVKGIAEDFRDTGDYERKFQVVETDAAIKLRDGAIPVRACARLENTSDHAAAVEFGNRGRAAHHPLGRTAEYLSNGGGG